MATAMDAVLCPTGCPCDWLTYHAVQGEESELDQVEHEISKGRSTPKELEDDSHKKREVGMFS